MPECVNDNMDGSTPFNHVFLELDISILSTEQLKELSGYAGGPVNRVQVSLEGWIILYQENGDLTMLKKGYFSEINKHKVDYDKAVKNIDKLIKDGVMTVTEEEF